MIPFSPLVIASHNAGKVREIHQLLSPYAIEVVSAATLGLPEPEETGLSFEENAALKSLEAAKRSGHWALADDSGLCVEALGGQPGIYSARWGGEGKDFALAMTRVHDELTRKGVEPTGAEAYFVCVLSLASPEGKVTAFEGRVYGTLTFPARGDKGFGYDPIFVPTGHQLSFAEMDPTAKQTMSHRAAAFQKFVDYIAHAGQGEVA